MAANVPSDYQYNTGEYAYPNNQPQYEAGQPIIPQNTASPYGYGQYPEQPPAVGQYQTYPEQPPMVGEVPQEVPKNQEFDIDYTSFIIRQGFIKKTYGILLSQLAISLIFISLTFIPSIREMILFDISTHPLVLVFLLVFVIVTIVVFSVFLCCRNVARTVPYNYILVFSFTLCMSFYLCLLCAQYTTDTVFSAVVLTFAATVGLTIYAANTKNDFTYCGGFLYAFCLTLIFSAGLFFWVGSYVFYCIGGVILYSFYIIYDTQLILGKFGNEFKIDDYCLAALNLYIDIIYLFIRILAILGSKKN